jgi:hypothetical protein
MASPKSFTRSFAGGEIAPLLYGRLDLTKYQTGLAKCLNFQITPQGPAENRAGFEYVIRAKDTATPPVLIPFTYNSEQSFALEFGNGYIRFHTLGGTLLETAVAVTGISVASTAVFTAAAHGFTNGQWVFLSGITGTMSALNGRWCIVIGATAGDFRLQDLFGNNIGTTGLVFGGAGSAARVYEIVSPYAAADLYDLHYVQSADVLTITHQGTTVRELRRLGATNWTLTAASFVPTMATPAAPTVTTGGPGGGTPLVHEYVVTAYAQGTLEESLQSASGSATLDLTVAGNFIDVQPAGVAGAVRYGIYKRKNGVYGLIGQSDGTFLRDNNIDPDMSQTPPLTNAPFAAENPRAVSYFEQRRCFGGGGTNTQTFWTTRSGTESNMTYSIPTQDDDAITARIVAREAQTVRHLVPLTDLLALTSGGVWRLTASDGGAITATSLSAKPQSYIGASNVQPIVTGESVLYAQDRGSHIREIGYRWDTQSFSASDVSVLAPHLFDFLTIKQMAYARNPYQVLWAVRSDGVLLGLTHQPEHDIRAWHQHNTAGLFKSVCAVPEGEEDGVYVVVKRTVQAADWYYIERQHSRQFSAIEDAFFVDSGATYDGAPATSITSGLWHLEGKSVAVLADGGVHPNRTVTNGSITLETAASTVQVGLAYTADLQTLPVAQEGAAAFGLGVYKNVNEVWLRVFQSSGIKAGPDFDSLLEYPQRTVSDNYGSPPGMVTGTVQMKLSPSWQRDGAVCVRQTAPLPLTVQSMTLEVASGG